ncbi:MAG: cytochrome c [Proteobacteria bacterium]|nr:cytochrome c [Pseudomonadota bacterium]MBI3499858.1 cytochrome c [Pseudomonadota bacterium]
MLRLFAVAALAALVASGPAQAQTANASAIARGQYIFDLGGCVGCHTDVKNNGKTLAGGRALRTPFGTFYGPNITSDPINGIGAWSEAEFIRAMRQGVAADGSNLFPVFPYPSFTKMSDGDLKDLFAYLKAQPAVAEPNRPHDIGFPFNLRLLQTGWKLMNYVYGPFKPDPKKPSEWNRGAYLVQAVAHCGECHTPRNLMGGLKTDLAFAGNADGPEGDRVPNITPDPGTGIGDWSPADLVDLLKSGMKPDGDVVGASMGEVVKNSTSKFTDDDIRAIVAYLRALPPIKNTLRKKS